MGGVGKTTLSKTFYNQKAFKYVKSCYLENVTSKGDKNVQKELLRGLCGEQHDQGKGVEKKDLDMIKECFLTQKVLVVLDDVSSEDSLRALQVFHALETGSRSKVVVTGRDRAILPKKFLKSGWAVIDDVNGIEKGSDLELFRQYAFDAIPEDAKEEVNTELLGEAEKIMQLCNGLPLSLEVLGKYLGNSEYKDLQQWKEIWADAHARLQKAQSIDGTKSDKLWSSLRISYDHLGDLEQKMFLDFACIFSEIMKVEKSRVEWIWGSPIGVQNLENKSLLKVKDGCFVMHDQLRDMGRHMLLKEALKDYKHPIYLWHSYDDHSETYLKFMKLKESGVPYIASLEQEVGRSLHQYSKIRLLHVSGCGTPSLVDDCLSQCSADLSWLDLGFRSGVTEIGIQNLCSFGGLRVIQISRCGNIVELPEDIGKLIDLVQIEVTHCSNLQSLPDNIGKLKNLKRLVIEYCWGLRVIPGSVGELPEVEYLSFEGCKHLTVIHGTQICTQKLRELKLPIVPTTCLRPCPQLRQLDIENGQRLKEFPQDFFKIDMPKLETVTWWNGSAVEVALKNADGSQLVLNRSMDFEVLRDDDGSISQFLDKRPSGTMTIRMQIRKNHYRVYHARYLCLVNRCLTLVPRGPSGVNVAPRPP